MEAMRKLARLCALSWAVFCIIPVWARVYGQEEAIVKQIDIIGSRRVEEGTIRFKLKTRVGEAFSVETLREDVKALYKLGFYDDIAVESEPFEGGLRLVFVFREKPTIRAVRVQGNKKIKTQKIREKIDLVEGGIVSPLALAQNAERIRLLYEDEEYYLARVEHSVQKVSEQAVDVTFKIEEGPKLKVKEIRVVGAKGLKEKQIKKRMATKERFLLFFGGTLKREELKRDLDRIKAFYMDNGYLDVKVEEPKIELDAAKNGLRVVLRVEEGPQFRLGEVSVSGNTLFSSEQILGALRLKKGAIFSREALQAEILQLTDAYATRGYLFADIVPNIKVDRERRVVDLSLEIEEGRQAFVERIEISGNTKTRDKVIRREIPLIEGDVFNSQLLQLSRANLERLGFFEEVKVETKGGSAPDKVRVEVAVKERPTGAFTFGGGYSSVDGPLLTGSVSQANLFGRGQGLFLQAQIGGRANRYNIRFSDPHILDTDNSFDISLFNLRRSFKTFQGFDEDTIGGSIGVGRRLYEQIFGTLGYRYESVKIFNFQPNAPLEVVLQEGKSITSAVALGLRRDTRNNPLDPTRGLRLSGLFEVAGGLLGGENYFTRYLAEASYYRPLFWKVTGHVRGQITLVDSFGGRVIPVQERVFYGGPNTIRGFENFTVSPRDPATGGLLGGNKGFFVNNELIIPLYAPFNVKGVIFFDIGNAYAEGEPFFSSIRTSVGVGTRFRTPVGPIRVEWGINLSPEPGEKKTQFHFTVGSFF